MIERIMYWMDKGHDYDVAAALAMVFAPFGAVAILLLILTFFGG